MRIHAGGFLLFEAMCTLSLLLFSSSLIFTWQLRQINYNREIETRIQSLYLACSVIEYAKLRQVHRYNQNLWTVTIQEQRDSALRITYVTVSVVRKDSLKAPFILKTAYMYE